MWTLLPDAGIQAGINNYILQWNAGCNYLSLPEKPASGNKVLKDPLNNDASANSGIAAKKQLRLIIFIWADSPLWLLAEANLHTICIIFIHNCQFYEIIRRKLVLK